MTRQETMGTTCLCCLCRSFTFIVGTVPKQYDLLVMTDGGVEPCRSAYVTRVILVAGVGNKHGKKEGRRRRIGMISIKTRGRCSQDCRSWEIVAPAPRPAQLVLRGSWQLATSPYNETIEWKVEKVSTKMIFSLFIKRPIIGSSVDVSVMMVWCVTDYQRCVIMVSGRRGG